MMMNYRYQKGRSAVTLLHNIDTIYICNLCRIGLGNHTVVYNFKRISHLRLL